MTHFVPRHVFKCWILRYSNESAAWVTEHELNWHRLRLSWLTTQLCPLRLKRLEKTVWSETYQLYETGQPQTIIASEPRLSSRVFVSVSKRQVCLKCLWNFYSRSSSTRNAGRDRTEQTGIGRKFKRHPTQKWECLTWLYTAKAVILHQRHKFSISGFCWFLSTWLQNRLPYENLFSDLSWMSNIQ